MAKQRINPPELGSTSQFGFSQLVATRGGTTVYLAGQVGWDAQGHIVTGGFAGQLEQTFKNIETALKAAGGNLHDVVSMRIYTTEAGQEDTTLIREALRHHFGPDHAPATTWLGVRALANPEFLIEIEAIAVIEEE